MLGLLVKLIVCPITVIIASYILPNVQYANLTQPIIVGLILAVSAHMMEVFIAILTAALLTLTEIFQHNWLLKSGRARKSPSN